jgi:ribosome recycling factor
MVLDKCHRIMITPLDPANVTAIVEALIEAGLNADALNPRAVAVGVPPHSGEQRAVREVTDEAGEEVEPLVKSKIKELWT